MPRLLRFPVLPGAWFALGAALAAAQAQSVTIGGITFSHQGLVGVGRVPAAQRDRYGETFGSLSGLALDLRAWSRHADGSYTGTLYSQPDRGYIKAGVSTNYQPRMNQLSLTFVPSPNGASSQNQIRLTLSNTTLFTEANGTPLTSLDPSATTSGVRPGFPPLPQAFINDRISIDAEGVVRLPNGTFFVSEEYGPYLHHLSATGVLLDSIRPPEAFIPKRNAHDSFSSNNPAAGQPAANPNEPVTGRENNQGLEGLALSADGLTLYALMQSALRQDGGADGNSQRRHARLLAYDVKNPSAPVLRSEWILPLPLFTQDGVQQVASVGDCLALNNHQFLVLVRDGNGRGTSTAQSLYHRVLIYEVASASNLAGTIYDNAGTPAAPKGVLPASIVPATSAVFIDLNEAAQLSKFSLNNGPADNANTLSDKWESLALAPALDPAAPDDFFLLIGNDNDYSTTDGRQDSTNFKADQNIDTMILAYRVTLPGVAAALRPAIATQPASRYVNAGTTVTFSVVADAAGAALGYQWKKSDVPIPGATANVLTLAQVQAADMDFYTVTVSSGAGAIDSALAILTVNDGGTSRLINVSTRGQIRAGEALTPGFVMRGTGSKSLLIRAIGPTLGVFGVAGALADPRMDVIPQESSTPVLSNDDWTVSNELKNAFGAVGAFPLPETGSKDAALLAAVTVTGASNNGYTVRITAGSSAASGIALAEVYDPEPLTSPVRLINVSTLGYAGQGEAGLTPGFVIGGSSPKLLLIRAVGPGLGPFGVPGVLPDPQVTVRPLNRSFTVASNNDWGDGGQSGALQAAFAAAGAFALPLGSKDAALVVRLPPDGYTVQVNDPNNGTGAALVEVYDLDP